MMRSCEAEVKKIVRCELSVLSYLRHVGVQLRADILKSDHETLEKITLRAVAELTKRGYASLQHARSAAQRTESPVALVMSLPC